MPTPRDELRAYLEKLKVLDIDKWRTGNRVKQNVYADNGRPVTQFHEIDDAMATVALRNAFPLLLEMAERALECDGCQGSGLRFQLWMNPVINEPCPSCTPRITRWAEQIEQVAKGVE